MSERVNIVAVVSADWVRHRDQCEAACEVALRERFPEAAVLVVCSGRQTRASATGADAERVVAICERLSWGPRVWMEGCGHATACSAPSLLADGRLGPSNQDPTCVETAKLHGEES